MTFDRTAAHGQLLVSLMQGVWAATIFVSLCGISIAQQTPPDAPSATEQSAKAGSPLKNSVDFAVLMQKRSHVFPDIAMNGDRLNAGDKFKLAVDNSVSLSTFGIAIIGAGWGQAVDRPSGWGEGGEAFGDRLGAELARSASDNFFGTFIIASALHEDPRFYVRRHLSFVRSVKYSAARVFLTRSDSGDRVVNYAGLLGPLASEGLANVYYPDNNRTAGATITRYGSDLAWKFGGNLARQYWPAINRKFHLMQPVPISPAPPGTPN